MEALPLITPPPPLVGATTTISSPPLTEPPTPDITNIASSGRKLQHGNNNTGTDYTNTRSSRNSDSRSSNGSRNVNISNSNDSLEDEDYRCSQAPSVWSLECQDGLVFAGCADGTIEIWDADTGHLKFMSSEVCNGGVTSLTVTGRRLVAARLTGTVDLYTVHVSSSNIGTTSTSAGTQPYRSDAWTQRRSSGSSYQCAKDADEAMSSTHSDLKYRSHRRVGSYEMPQPSLLHHSSTPPFNNFNTGNNQFSNPPSNSVIHNNAQYSSNNTANQQVIYHHHHQQQQQSYTQHQFHLQQEQHQLQQVKHCSYNYSLNTDNSNTDSSISYCTVIQTNNNNNRGNNIHNNTVGYSRSTSSNSTDYVPSTNSNTSEYPTRNTAEISCSNNTVEYIGSNNMMNATSEYIGSRNMNTETDYTMNRSSRNYNNLEHYSDGGRDNDIVDDDEYYSVWLVRDVSNKAHHQPISVLCCDDTRVLTGSLDHTLKVIRLQDGVSLFTLHGHLAPITTATIGGPAGEPQQEGDAVLIMGTVSSTAEGARKRSSTSSSTGGAAVGGGGGVVGVYNERNSLEGAIIASGAQDGSLCVWDLATGACVYSVSGHSGAVQSIVTSSSYLISFAADDKLAVWERFQGHLLNTLHLTDMFCSTMIMLTSKLLITTRQGRLCVWDVSTGVEVLEVSLGSAGQSVFPRHLLAVGASIICDYGNSLRTVRMPVAEKME